MKPVAANAPFLPPASRDGVGACLQWDGRVERGVEDGHMRNGGERSAGLVDCPQGRRVVQGCERRQLLDGGRHLHGEQDRLPEPLSAVHDAMSDSTDALRQRGEACNGLGALLGVHHRQLQARRARVDDQDAL